MCYLLSSLWALSGILLLQEVTQTWGQLGVCLLEVNIKKVTERDKNKK